MHPPLTLTPREAPTVRNCQPWGRSILPQPGPADPKAFVPQTSQDYLKLKQEDCYDKVFRRPSAQRLYG